MNGDTGKSGNVHRLAFDTCLNACSVALWNGTGGALYARYEPMRRGHAERLCPMIEDVLAEAACTLATIDSIAVTVGPGTFTGTRVGIAAARGFALATGAKVLGSTSLALLAATARAALPADRHGRPNGRPIAACIDGGKGLVMLEIVRIGTVPGLAAVQLLAGPAAAMTIAALAPDAVLIGSAARIVADAGKAAGLMLEAVLPDIEPDARHFADMALVPLAAPAPLYLRPPDAKPQQNVALARTL